jgi:hypothetical protein
MRSKRNDGKKKDLFQTVFYTFSVTQTEDISFGKKEVQNGAGKG